MVILKRQIINKALRLKHMRILILAAIVSVLLGTGCKDDRNELFDIPQVVDFTIPAGLNTFETHFFQLQVNSSFDDQLAATGRQESDVASIEPKFCEVATIFKDRDLDFIRAIEIHVFDTFDPQSRREVFYLDPVPGNTRTTIRPFPGLQNVVDIVSDASYGVEIRLRFFATPPTTLDMRLEFEFAAFAD